MPVATPPINFRRERSFPSDIGAYNRETGRGYLVRQVIAAI
jgi:hypothetical protein